MANSFIYHTNAADGNKQKFTHAFWVKRSDVGVYEELVYSAYAGNTWRYAGTAFTNNDVLTVYSGIYQSGSTGSTTLYDYYTNRKFRDVGAWYHIVVAVDTTIASPASDRVKIFVNGVRETSFSSATDPSLNGSTYFNADTKHSTFGAANRVAVHSPSAFLNGVMSHCYWIDGTAYDASTFGEVDATSGIWKIKTSPSVTYGTNGFFLKMEDRTNLDLDSGTNGFTMTTTGTITPTYDNPSNNFCTLNPLANYINGSTFTDGNNTMTTANNTRSYNIATMGLTSGKWYFETYMNELVSGTGQNTLIGIADAETTAVGNQLGILASQYAYYSTTGGSYNSNTDTGYGDTYTTGNYIGTYIDLDNNKIYWAKDGVIQNSGTGVTITAASGTSGGAYLPALGFWSNTPIYKYNLNFGNGYFGTTVISSPEADAGGIGAFKYDPSVGTFDSSSKDFRAICTRNIKDYG
jgi:hypothetical protein